MQARQSFDNGVEWGDGWTSLQPLKRGDELAACAADAQSPMCCAESCAEGFVGDGSGGCVACSLALD